MNLRLNLFLTPLQQVIDRGQKGELLSVSELLNALELWPVQDDLQKMRLAKALRRMVDSMVLDNIRLSTHGRTRHAVYEIL